MDPTKEQHQILCKSQKSATETLPMIRQAFGEESSNSPRPKEARQEIKVKSMIIIFFDIKGIFQKNPSVTYCCDILQQLRENM
jgi:hypothetical protein